MSLHVLEGLRPWVIQRVSAVYIVFFLLYVCYGLFVADVLAYEAWTSWLYTPFNTLATGIFAIALLFHAWIGMRDVVLDYIHNTLLRIFILAMLVGILLGCGLWLFKILLLSVVM